MKPLCALAFALLVVAGCGGLTPPAPAPIRDATPVAAGFDATWDAVIDQFAASNTPIETLEKASGIIVSATLRANREEHGEYADCGSSPSGSSPIGYRPAPASVVYNVLVRGDDERSSVRVTAFWSGNGVDCNTTGIWEAEMEEAVRERAERSP